MWNNVFLKIPCNGIPCKKNSLKIKFLGVRFLGKSFPCYVVLPNFFRNERIRRIGASFPLSFLIGVLLKLHSKFTVFLNFTLKSSSEQKLYAIRPIDHSFKTKIQIVTLFNEKFEDKKSDNPGNCRTRNWATWFGTFPGARCLCISKKISFSSWWMWQSRQKSIFSSLDRWTLKLLWL